MKVIQIIPSFVLGGAEIMCESLTNALIAHGVETIVVSLYDYRSPITERLERRGVKIVYLGKRKGFDLRMIFMLVRILRQVKPDVIHTHLYTSEYAVPAAIIAGVKGRIHTVHSVAYREGGKLFRIASRFFYKYLNVLPVALSKLIRETIVRQYNLKEDNIPVIFNGIDLDKCKVKVDYAVDSTFKVLHVGRFDEIKNHRMLMKVFSDFCQTCPNSELHLVGEGTLELECKKYAKELGIENSVIFHGASSQVYDFYYQADMFVLPSKSEGIPLTIIEAMGSAMPILATAVGGIPDMIENETSGLLVNVSKDELLSAMCKLYYNQGLREYLGKNALIRSQFFSSKEMAGLYLNEYKKICRQKKSL